LVDTQIFLLTSDYATTNGAPLVLKGAMYHKSHSKDLFAWGNGLFYSPNGGQTWSILRSLDSESTISFFAAGESDSYAFVTDDFRIFYGIIGTTTMMQIKTAEPKNQDRVLYPIFDDNDQLYTLDIRKSNNRLSIERQVINVKEAVDYVSKIEKVQVIGEIE
jgi:hypothetical protein